jgi:cyclophilin family peptidyl-prolyl cis-trans isomerase
MLSCLRQYPPALDFVVNELRNADTAIIRSMAAATVTAMNYHKSLKPHDRIRFSAVYKDLMQSQTDPAVLASIATALADTALGHREILQDPAFLYTAKSKLRLPEHYEAFQPVESAIAYFEGRPEQIIRNEFNHPIDWNLVAELRTDQRVTIKTTRGDIVIRLFINESPGSVANFLALARQDYFDDKLFHRVVPNFVIQTGCKRGDGWGAEDYSIRSEFSPRAYATGSVGMASAGKDTEGTQWFITHSPTPHLDGRYTLFAEVVEGMRVIDYIGVGDRIIDVVVDNIKGK